VGAEQRGGSVQDLHPGLRQPIQRPQALLDAVKVITHVEPRQREIAAAEREQRLPWRHHLDRCTAPAAAR
jgi:hypothetical protein